MFLPVFIIPLIVILIREKKSLLLQILRWNCRNGQKFSMNRKYTYRGDCNEVQHLFLWEKIKVFLLNFFAFLGYGFQIELENLIENR